MTEWTADVLARATMAERLAFIQEDVARYQGEVDQARKVLERVERRLAEEVAMRDACQAWLDAHPEDA